MSLPITLINQRDVLPRRYLVHKHSQFCKGCGSLHEWSQVYAFNEMLSRTGAGRFVTHLVPIDQILYNLPVSVSALERKLVPVCHECADTANLSHLPDPRGTDEWNRIYAVCQAPTAPPRVHNKPRPAHQKSPPRTIDDLLSDL